MSQDDSSTNRATKKYQQIVVPDHALKPDTSGTSFLRTGTFPSLTDATKQPPGFQKSLALARLAGDPHLKTGGSWHHVDGNRIETTTGRKVEVIAGSYVAHRGPANSPGPAVAMAWSTHSYTQTGSEDLPVGWHPTVDASQQVTGATAPSAATNDTAGLASSLSHHYQESYDAPPTTPGGPGASLDTSAADSPSLQDGDVVATTWAQRILTYVGSAGRPIPLVFAETYAETSRAYSYFSVAGYTYVGSEDRPVPVVYAETHAGSLGNKTFASGDITTWNHTWGSVWADTAAGGAILTTQEAAIDISVFNTAPILTTVNTAAAQATINVGMALGTLNVAFLIGSFNIGPNLTVNMPSSVTFTGDETGVKLASADLDGVTSRVTATETSIKGVTSDISAMRTRISATETHLSETDSRVSGIQTYLALQLLAGM